MIKPYLNDSIKSGFFYFKTPNDFQPGKLYQVTRMTIMISITLMALG